jgi:hypothetical protein
MIAHKEELLVTERTICGVNAYVTLSLNGTVDIGEIQFGEPSKRQLELGIYPKEQVKRILNERGYAFA